MTSSDNDSLFELPKAGEGIMHEIISIPDSKKKPKLKPEAEAKRAAPTQEAAPSVSPSPAENSPEKQPSTPALHSPERNPANTTQSPEKTKVDMSPSLETPRSRPQKRKSRKSRGTGKISSNAYRKERDKVDGCRRIEASVKISDADWIASAVELNKFPTQRAAIAAAVAAGVEKLKQKGQFESQG